MPMQQLDGRIASLVASGSHWSPFKLMEDLGWETFWDPAHMDDAVAIKLEPINHLSSVQCKYHILKNLEGGVGIPCALWFGDQLLSRLKYIHSHNYIHGDIKPQNVVVGLGDLKHTAFIIDFGTVKEFWNVSTGVHIPFCQGQHLTSTPAFTSINDHLGVELGRRDDLESLVALFHG
ncbi:CSNK1A1 protein [Suillus ampliporus]|nr:CSNK1A1 protein [Suillus ampliporus]